MFVTFTVGKYNDVINRNKLEEFIEFILNMNPFN